MSGDPACLASDAVIAIDAPKSAAKDEQELPAPRASRRLLRPGGSDRLPVLGRHAWTSSNSVVCPGVIRTLARPRNRQCGSVAGVDVEVHLHEQEPAGAEADHADDRSSGWLRRADRSRLRGRLGGLRALISMRALPLWVSRGRSGLARELLKVLKAPARAAHEGPETDVLKLRG